MRCQINETSGKHHLPCNFLGPGGKKRKDSIKNLEWSARMRRRSTSTGLIVKASRVLQKTVEVLSEPESGTAMQASGNASTRVNSCRTRETS